MGKGRRTDYWRHSGEVYRCLVRRRDALSELVDAVLFPAHQETTVHRPMIIIMSRRLGNPVKSHQPQAAIVPDRL